MRRDEVNALYNRQYAAEYEDKFIHRDICRSDAEFEVKVLAKAIERAEGPWLDVGCGTGYFLSRFPGCHRAGMDISEAMLERARAANPEVEFYQHDFRVGRPEWQDAWGLVSSMWHAYGYVETLEEFDRFLSNIADWTAPCGTLFLPYLDLNGLWETALPFEMPNPYQPAKVHITGLIWTFVDDDKVHRNMIAPHAEYIGDGLRRRFNDVRVVEYPPAMPEWKIARKAFLAEQKRA
jgi:SAM-dependent methyltransferase